MYKADLDEVVGVGWIPIGSLDVLKAKNAAKILSDRLYRTKQDTLKYKTDMTSMPMVLAKANADVINKVKYLMALFKIVFAIYFQSSSCGLVFMFFCFSPQRKYIAAWEAEKIKTHVNPDTPELLLSKANAYNISKVCLVCFYLI